MQNGIFAKIEILQVAVFADVGNERSRFHMVNAVAVSECGLVVRGDDDGDSRPCKPCKKAVHLAAVFFVEVACRFVSDDQVWLVGECPCNGDAAQFATGQILRVFVCQVRNAELVQQRLDMFLVDFFIVQGRCQGDVLGHGECGKAGCILRNVTDAPVTQVGEFFVAQLEDGLAVDFDAAGCWRGDACECVQKRALAASGFSEDDRKVSGPCEEISSVDRIKLFAASCILLCYVVSVKYH